MMVRKPGKLDVVVVFQTRPGSARLASSEHYSIIQRRAVGADGERGRA